MSDFKRGMLPRPGALPLLNRIRKGRPELPADWAMLSDDEIRERLRGFGCSEQMIEDELRQYSKYRERQRKAPPEPEPETTKKSGFMGDLDRTLKRHVKKGGE